jgi:hypothetical protein
MVTPFNTKITLWQVAQPRRKLGGFEQHLLMRGSWHFECFTTGGKNAVNQSQICINDLHLEHNAFVIDISFEEVDLKFIMCLE